MARDILGRRVPRLLAPLVGAAQEGATALASRWELARLEWAIERGRLVQSLVGLAILALGGLFALAFAGLALIVTWWDTDHRVMVAWLVVGACVSLALVGLFMWRFAELRKERRFAALRAEFTADRDWIAQQWRGHPKRDG